MAKDLRDTFATPRIFGHSDVLFSSKRNSVKRSKTAVDGQKERKKTSLWGEKCKKTPLIMNLGPTTIIYTSSGLLFPIWNSVRGEYYFDLYIHAYRPIT